MADGLTLNPGAAGATLATDEAGASNAHYQVVKLADGAADSEARIGGDATYGLDVDVTRVQGTVTADVSDRAGRDCGRVDVASLDQYTPEDVDSGAGTVNALPVTLKVSGAGGVSITGDAGNGLDVDVTRVGGNVTVVQGTGTNLHTVVDSGTITTVSAVTALTNALPSGTNNIGDVDVLTVPADPFGANADAASASGSISAKLREIATNGVPLKAGAAAVGTVGVTSISAGANRIGKVTVRNAADAADIDPVAEATFTGRIGEVQAAPTANTVLARLRDLLTGIVLAAGTAIIGKVGIDQTTDGTTNKVAATQATASNLNAQVVGTIAHDGADSGNPVKVGAKAITDLAGATMVAAADRTDLYADLDGVQIVKIGTPYNNLLSERVSNTDGNSTALTNFGATANARNMITCIVVHNKHASTNGYVDIRDGTGGTILMTIPLPANGGAVVPLNPPLRQPTANTALAFDVSAAIDTVYLSFNGFKSRA